MSAPVASLPMYDWPEVRGATDALWARMRAALATRGLPAPERLSRDATHWDNPDLALGHTCGLPYRQRLHARTTLIGAPDLGLDACAPGQYRSALVARLDDPRDDVQAFRDARFAFNEVGSQSGWAALVAALGPREPREGHETGGHRASVQAVAAGRADIAAIDAASWRLAEAWEPAAHALRVVGWTRPTPAPPLIVAGRRDPAPWRQAMSEAIAGLDAVSRAAIGWKGFVVLTPEDYFEASAAP